MDGQIFLDQHLGSFQFFQPFSGGNKLLFIDSNQGLHLGNGCSSSGNDLFCILGDDLGFFGIVDQPLVDGLEVMEMTGFFNHLLLHLSSPVFLSGEKLIQC